MRRRGRPCSYIPGCTQPHTLLGTCIRDGTDVARCLQLVGFRMKRLKIIMTKIWVPHETAENMTQIRVRPKQLKKRYRCDMLKTAVFLFVNNLIGNSRQPYSSIPICDQICRHQAAIPYYSQHFQTQAAPAGSHAAQLTIVSNSVTLQNSPCNCDKIYWYQAGIALIRITSIRYNNAYNAEAEPDTGQFYVQTHWEAISMFYPRDTTAARKRPRSFCHMCRRLITPKHTYSWVARLCCC